MTPKEALHEARAWFSPASGRGQALLTLAVEARSTLNPEQSAALRAQVLASFQVDDEGAIADSAEDAHDGLGRDHVDELAELGMVRLLANGFAKAVDDALGGMVAAPAVDAPAADAAPKKRGAK